jgi:undecaprenyl-diphosphatase
VTTDGPLTSFDEDGAQWLNDRFAGRDGAIAVLRAISFTGKPIFLLVVVGLPVLWALRRGARRTALFLAVTSIGGGLVDSAVKVAVGRPRPEVDEPIATAFGKSFPSGHSMAAVVCYGALLLVALPFLSDRGRRLAVTGTALLVALIGFSRLTLGVHFLSDVLGGYVLGAAWLSASVAAFEIWREERDRPRTAPLTEGIEPEEAEALAEGTPS